MDFTAIAAEFRDIKHRRGIIADVAKRLSLSHEHVRQVAMGARTSLKVQRALLCEVRKRDRQRQRQQLKQVAA